MNHSRRNSNEEKQDTPTWTPKAQWGCLGTGTKSSLPHIWPVTWERDSTSLVLDVSICKPRELGHVTPSLLQLRDSRIPGSSNQGNGR